MRADQRTIDPMTRWLPVSAPTDTYASGTPRSLAAIPRHSSP